MLTGRKLLLADDSLTIQKVVSLTFSDEAMEVLTVGSGAEALEKLHESVPDIVLADVLMPEPNGYQLCERIKSDERTRHIPVVLLVGTFEPFNESEARRVGADEVLTKPFQSIRDLVNKVGGLLGGSDEKHLGDAQLRDKQHADETTHDLSPFAADAHTADPNIEPHAEEAATTTTTAADPFNDFDMDDATIQSTPAAVFDAQHEHAPPVLEIKEEEQFSDRAETDEAFVLEDDDAPAQSHAATGAAAVNSFATSPIASTGAASVEAAAAFSAHAARAAEADDALLELGDIAPAHSGSDAAAANEADDFILDIGDEDSFEPIAAAPAEEHFDTGARAAALAEADMHFAEHAPLTMDAPEAFIGTEAFAELQTLAAEPQASAEADMRASPVAATAEAGAMPFAEEPEDMFAEESEDAGAPEISVSPSLLFANEPATDARSTESSTGQESESSSQPAPVWDGDPAAASAVAHAGGVAQFEAPGESQTAESFAADASSEAVAAGEASAHAASSESSQLESNQTAASASLSPEMLDEVVRRVVAQMSEQVVREIAWEVVPDLAERLIKQRLEEEKMRQTP